MANAPTRPLSAFPIHDLIFTQIMLCMNFWNFLRFVNSSGYFVVAKGLKEEIVCATKLLRSSTKQILFRKPPDVFINVNGVIFQVQPRWNRQHVIDAIKIILCLLLFGTVFGFGIWSNTFFGHDASTHKEPLSVSQVLKRILSNQNTKIKCFVGKKKSKERPRSVGT